MKIPVTSPYIALLPFTGAVALYVLMPASVLEAAIGEQLLSTGRSAASLCMLAVLGVLLGYSIFGRVFDRPRHASPSRVLPGNAFICVLLCAFGLALARLLVFFKDHSSRLTAGAEELRALKLDVAANPIDLPGEFSAPILVAIAVLLWSGRLSLGRTFWAKAAVWGGGAIFALSGLIAPMYKGARGEFIVLIAVVLAARTARSTRMLSVGMAMKASLAMLGLAALFLLSANARGQTGEIGYLDLFAGYFVAPVNRVALLMSGGDAYLQDLGVRFFADGFIGEFMSLTGSGGTINTADTWIVLFDLVRSAGLNPAYNWITAPGALYVDMGYKSLVLYPLLGIAWRVAERKAAAGSLGAGSLLGLFFAAGLGFFGANNVLLAHGFWWVVVICTTVLARVASLNVRWSHE